MLSEQFLVGAIERCDLSLAIDFEGVSKTEELASSSSADSPNKAPVRYVNSGSTIPLNAKSSVPMKDSAESKRIGHLTVLDESGGPQLPATPMT